MVLFTDTVQDIQRNWRIILLAFLAGGGGNYTMNLANPPRPDPWTGTQGREQAQRITENENEITALQIQFSSMMEQCSGTITRVTKLENGLPPPWLLDRIKVVEQKADTCQALLLEMRRNK